MNFENLKVVANPTLVREYALEKLRTAIATGLYLPGARLIERDLCEALGVSRTSVREALRQLQSEGLIENGARRSITVSILNETDATDIYTLREQVETLAVRRLVARRDLKALKALQIALKAVENLSRKNDLPALSEGAGVFYETILEGAGSRVILDAGRQLLNRVSYLRLTSMSSSGRVADGIAEWREIVVAIAAHDADAASAALSRHIRNSCAAAVARLAEGTAPERTKIAS